jgi:hypothetical protein
MTFVNFTSFVLQLVAEYQPNNLDLIISLIGFEIGTIFVVSGFYKCSAGYLHGRGINVGLNNPMWAYRYSYWHSWTPLKNRTKLINYASILGEIMGGLLLMSMKYQFVGALIITIMFLGVMLMVRLASLCPAIIFVTLGTQMISSANEKSFGQAMNPQYFSLIAIAIQVVLFLVYIGISVNFYVKKSLPKFLQVPINIIVSFIGISLWRVFTSDMTSILIRIFDVDSQGNRRELSNWDLRENRRFNFVGEAISVTSIFTLLKYQSSQAVFNNRLISYAHTFPSSLIEFEYHYVSTSRDRISTRHVRTYIVDSTLAKITEVKVDPKFDPCAPEEHSYVTAKTQYGHYN